MRWVFAGAAAVAAIGAAVFLFERERTTTPPQPSYAQLVAENYRVLTAAQSRRLARYARAVHRCVAAHGGSFVAEPAASPTRIAMAAPGRSARELVRLLAACDAAVRPPPPRPPLPARRRQ